MKFEDKPFEKENYLPPRKRPYNPNPPKKDCFIPAVKSHPPEYYNNSTYRLIDKSPGTPTGGIVAKQLDLLGTHPDGKNSGIEQNLHPQGHHDHDDDDERLYCVCKEKYNSNIFMIGCDFCENWFHGKCVGITAIEARKIKNYVCAECKGKGHVGPTVVVTKEKKTTQGEKKGDKKRPNEFSTPIDKKKKVTALVPDASCPICHIMTTDRAMLVCERCRTGFHASCLRLDPNFKGFLCVRCIEDIKKIPLEIKVEKGQTLKPEVVVHVVVPTNVVENVNK